jgi:hypothetical protein
MRFTTAVYFQNAVEGEYNENTGNYNADTVTEVKKYASVTDSGIETVRLVYGELKQGSLTIRLQQPFKGVFNRIRIGDKLYNVDFSSCDKTFVVSEVQ